MNHPCSPSSSAKAASEIGVVGAAFCGLQVPMRQEFYTLSINLDYETLEDVEVAVAIATKCSYCAISSREGGDEG